jgi:hypothetical protein
LCGAYHAELPLGYGVPAPDYWHAIPEGERRKRARLSDETCVLDGEHFFIKGHVEIPIHGQDTLFTWTVWTSLSQPNYERALRLWHDSARVNEPPYFGWLSTRLPPYPDTLSLKTHVHTRAVGLRPLVELEHTEHPLAVEQRTGITLARVQEIAERQLSVPFPARASAPQSAQFSLNVCVNLRMTKLHCNDIIVNEELTMMAPAPRTIPETLQQTWEQATRHPDALVALAASRRFWEQWARWQSTLTGEALNAGATWDDVGQALATSRQAAWARFRKATDEQHGGASMMQDQLAQVRRQLGEDVKALRQRARQRDDQWRVDRQHLRDQLRALDKQRADDRLALQGEIRELQQKMRSTRQQQRALVAEPPSG